MEVLSLVLAYGLGVAELGVSTKVTQAVSEKNIAAAEAYTLASVLMWFYVINNYALDMQSNMPEIAAYTAGAMTGVYLAMKMREK